MALLDNLAQILVRLAPRGWAALLQQHGGGLDITKPKSQLAAELVRPLTGINRQHPPALRSSRPAHDRRSTRALRRAACCITRWRHQMFIPSRRARQQSYPTPEDLDVVENYIFSLAPRKLSSFRNPVIAIFACRSRARAHTAHGQHADLAFSRTGVARVGTEAERYDGPSRSFDIRCRR